MERLRPFKNLLCCCFGVSSHDGNKQDGHADHHDENDNDDNDAVTAVFDNGIPNLCSTCRAIDFKSLFTSHYCPVEKGYDGTSIVTHPKECRCEYELEPRTGPMTVHRRGFRVLPGKPESDASSACSFCHFLYQCQARLNLIPSDQDSWYCAIKSTHSLGRIPIQMDGGVGGGRELEKWGISQPILRVVDSGGKTLVRGRHAGGGLRGRKLDPKRADYKLIGEWLELCRSTHANCKELDTGRIRGLQAIDCTTSSIVPFPPEDTAADQKVPYVTLSYLWGPGAATQGPIVRPNTGDGGSTSRLALPDEIPLVIRDAIRVVEQLGYRYLWVDRYCIPQDDAAAKHSQIMNMGRIYSGSVVTIVAAAGEVPEYGLPGVSSRARTSQLGLDINDELSLVLYEAPKDHILKSKWNTRGWTYQEGLLPKRRLIFTDAMVYFQCQEMHVDEVMSLPIPGPGEDFDEVRVLSFANLSSFNDLGMVFPRTTDWSDPSTAWDRIGEYGTRELGWESDALNAISGVMGMYALQVEGSAFKSFYGFPILPVRSWKRYGNHDESDIRGCSFRTWFEDPSDPDTAASEAQEIDEMNLTCSLVYSLAWRYWWGDDREFEPANFEKARRSIFGSWLWAGWRTRKYEPSYMTLFDTSLRIRVQYSSDLLLDWEDDNNKILDLSYKGEMPESLNIKGVVLDVELNWARRQMEHGRREWKLGWVLSSPFNWNKDLFESPRWLFEEDGRSGEGSGTGFLFLVLGCYYWDGMPYQGITGMILRPVLKMLDGQPHAFYERLYCDEFELSLENWPEMGRLTRETEVRLI
ncbi:heterokaryon incompatibility protein-domain-containing protein [Sordaria brevicollis]|uniref:Heterokaryon incompatibility protein-domain-containing protein n=1 Tax=Sordaria brevicollis TaxID=83679 RepID=A0AAE0PKA2_SORBR|nr:heterokaryon incompatibility protein-domain-containing protein [Sordaria brevicollis]